MVQVLELKGYNEMKLKLVLQVFGRTPLTDISPKKTWEGAVAGIGGCIATTAVLSKLLSWPQSMLRCAVNLYSTTFCLKCWLHYFCFFLNLGAFTFCSS